MTGEVITHCVRACPAEYNRNGKVTWMDFLKVARTEEKSSEDDGDFGGSDGAKFQTEWLPVEGSLPQFFEHLIRSLEAYLPHSYETKLSNWVDKCAERAFLVLVDLVIQQNCPGELKGVVFEVNDFASDIHTTRHHDLTCSFLESHKCEVHHLSFAPTFVLVDEIETKHPRTARKLRKRGVAGVLCPENTVIY